MVGDGVDFGGEVQGGVDREEGSEGDFVRVGEGEGGSGGGEGGGKGGKGGKGRKWFFFPNYGCFSFC